MNVKSAGVMVVALLALAVAGPAHAQSDSTAASPPKAFHVWLGGGISFPASGTFKDTYDNGWNARGMFSYQSPDGQVPTAGESMSLFWLEPTGFRSYELEPSPTTHDEVVKIAGLNYEESYASKGKLSKFVFGAFAASWTPQASCIDCQLVRLYARFNVVYEL